MPTLIESIEKSPPAIYYGKRFRTMIEDHLPYLLQMPSTQLRVFGGDDYATINKYVGDFYGFLTAISYSRQYHWTILRMNGFRSRLDLKVDLSHLILPDWEFVDKLAQLSKEKSK